ncbi:MULTISPECIES: mandelate racemase/muconate lactonizing enzyme family protein [Methylorubrum]|uniref:mandelate racemase/muconate lactonizing enzyme family protein n=1 Tax=Methylorubrum TaxID=2282523 RepID=UPI001152233B|nr:mandelate racemase/muconate lactonizing enzyme family protein [Methylorubrum populi]QDI82298.1 mandelate racemase/muconate lactonizing enzyme family protein [Methylorubrum populi]
MKGTTITRVSTLRSALQPNLLWVEIEDADGVVGLGETFSLAETVESYIHEGAADYLLGKDGGDIAGHWTTLFRQRGRSGIGAETRGAAAIDIALWDLLGHRTGLPLWQLLGGRSRERIRVYNTCGGPNYVRAAAVAGRQYTGDFVRDRYDDLWGFMNEPERLAESLLAEGVRHMKIWPLDDISVVNQGLHISAAELRTALAPLARIHKAFEGEMEVALEMHARWTVPVASKIARAAEPYQPMWIEDPVKLDNLRAIDEVCRATTIPVLVGETQGSRYPYREILERTGVGIIMSDPCWTGGVTELRRIADLAATYQRAFTPHDCTGPIGLAAGAHVALHAETAIFQEFVRAFYHGWYREVSEGLPVIENGWLSAADRPGHGVTIPDEVRKRAEWSTRTSRKGA